MTNMVDFTPEMRDRLRRAYDKALRDKTETFKLDGNEHLVAYVKYLLEYLDGMFGKGKR